VLYREKDGEWTGKGSNTLYALPRASLHMYSTAINSRQLLTTSLPVLSFVRQVRHVGIPKENVLLNVKVTFGS